jgi:hypothetical protein
MQIPLWGWVRSHLQPHSRWRDLNDVAYELIGEARLHSGAERLCGEGAQLCVYRAGDGSLHAMPHSEFHDGRFRKSGPTTPQYLVHPEMG